MASDRNQKRAPKSRASGRTSPTSATQETVRMSPEEVVRCFVSLKHKLEGNKDLLTLTPPNTALVLSHEGRRVLASRLDGNAIKKLPCPTHLVEQARSMLDDSAMLDRDKGIRYTVILVFNRMIDLTALVCVAWDDDEKIGMTVFIDNEVVVLDEHL